MKHFYKPKELTSDKFENLVGSVRPLFDSKYDLDLYQPLNYEDLICGSIEQLNHIANLLDDWLGQSMQTETFFRKFNSLILDYTSNSSQCQFNNKIDYLRKRLPKKWIYERDKNKLLAPQNFSFSVKYPTDSEILKLPQVYLNDSPNLKNLFHNFGVKEFFSIEFLVSQLSLIKKRFALSPLDPNTIEVCKNLLLEIINVSETGMDKSFGLKELKEAFADFSLPDSSGVMRNVKNLCSGKLNDCFSSKTEIYSLHESIYGADKFGIEDAKVVFSQLIGKPFGQSEQLIKRINGILQNYCDQICVFTELIQNADDAKATEIRFVLDRRQLPTQSTFGSSFTPLQGNKGTR